MDVESASSCSRAEDRDRKARDGRAWRAKQSLHGANCTELLDDGPKTALLSYQTAQLILSLQLSCPPTGREKK